MINKRIPDDVLSSIVAKAKAGDQAAFTELYEVSREMVYLVCYGQMRNPEDAEDCTQETFINIYKKLDSLQDNRTYFGWAKTIASRVCLNKLATIKNNLSYDDAIESGMNLEGEVNIESLPDAAIMDEDKRNTVLKILNNELNEVQYQTIFMHYYNEMPLKQIAELMNVPEGTVKTRISAAKKKLKDAIETYEKETGCKLCAAGTFPALAMLFNSSLGQIGVPSVPFSFGSIPGLSIPEATGAGAKAVIKAAGKEAGKTAGKSAAKASSKMILLKGLCGIAAVGVLGVGGILIMNQINNKQDEKVKVKETTVETQAKIEIVFDTPEPTPSVTEPEVTPEPTPEILNLNNYISVSTSQWYNPEYDVYKATFDLTLTLPDQAVADEINQSLENCSEYAVIRNSDEMFTIIVRGINQTGQDSEGDVYKGFTINTSTGKCLTNEEILAIAGIDSNDFHNLSYNSWLSAVDAAYKERHSLGYNAQIYNGLIWVSPGSEFIVNGQVNPQMKSAFIYGNLDDYFNQNTDSLGKVWLGPDNQVYTVTYPVFGNGFAYNLNGQPICELASLSADMYGFMSNSNSHTYNSDGLGNYDLTYYSDGNTITLNDVSSVNFYRKYVDDYHIYPDCIMTLPDGYYSLREQKNVIWTDSNGNGVIDWQDDFS